LENIKIEATAKTPQIDFNHLTGELILTGKSIPENAAKLYEDVLNWVKEYVEQPNKLTNFRLNLEYFNTSSTMWIARMVKTLSSIKKPDSTLIVHFYYDILEFESMDSEDLIDVINPVVSIAGDPIINIGLKVYGVGSDGQVLKETMVLI